MTDPAESAREAASVRKVTESDRPRVIAALARAFYDDPNFGWLFRDGSRRLRQLADGFALFGRRIWFRHDHGYTTDSVAGAALWLPPGEWHLSPLAQLALIPAIARHMRPGELVRFMRATNQLERRHPGERHFYLPIIGVSPEWQGRGLGTALLRPVLDRCDRDEIPAYLEASTPRSRACYERSGFVVEDEVPLPGGGPPWWAMWRKPRATVV